jgi:NADPH:quinone reductase-like Zn-dependent oxidoreductase
MEGFMSAQTMKQWRLNAPGRQNLQLISVPVPSPEENEVLVKVNAVSLNYRDKSAIEEGAGLPPTFPVVPASDLAGEVIATGAGVERFHPGQRVISSFEAEWLDGRPLCGTARNPPYRTLGGVLPGVLSEYVAFPQDWFVHAPDSLDDMQASTLPVAGLTAWSALVGYGHLHAGQTVLVQGTGGVSLFALQIAVAHGASVIVTSSSDDKLERAKLLGAFHVINRLREDWVEAVYRITNDRGVDHVLEMAGGANFGRSVEAVSIQGRISVIGVFDGFSFSGPTGPLLRKQVSVQGIGVGHRSGLEDLVRAIDRTGIKPIVARRYGFNDLNEALDHLEAGPFGKVVVEVGSGNR